MSFLEYTTFRLASFSQIISKYWRLPVVKLCFGILVGLYFASATEILFVASGVLLLLRRWELVILLLGLLAGVGRYGYISDVIDYAATFSGQQFEGELYVLTDGELGKYAQSFWASAPGIPGMLLVETSKYPQVTSGQSVYQQGELGIPQNISDDFDYQMYLQSNGIYLTLQGQDHLIMSTNESIDTLAAGIRHDVSRMATQHLFEPQSSLFTGLTIGKGATFDPDLEAKLQNSGTTHLVAVSGSNVALLVIMAMRFKGFVHRKYLLYMLPLVLLIFLLVVGRWNLPTYRATLMATIALVGMWFGRKATLPLGILVACCLIMFENPFVIHSVSFQLSIVALLGVFWLGEPLKSLISRLPDLLSDTLSMTLAASLPASAVGFLTFGGYSISSLFANLVLVPLVGVVSVVLLVVACLSVAIPMITAKLYVVIDGLLQLIVEIVEIFGGDQFYIQQPTSLLMAALIVFTVIVYNDYRKKKNCSS